MSLRHTTVTRILPQRTLLLGGAIVEAAFSVGDCIQLAPASRSARVGGLS